MAVVGVDIGDHSTYISVARLGAVDTISNDYSLRASPSIVAFGERQRFVGVSAENQRNLNPKNTVSFFKNTVGQSYKDVDSIAKNFGAKVLKDDKGRLLFEIHNQQYLPEQMLGILFTKIKELVMAAEGENIETLVVSVPIYFSQAQRLAVRDAALIAGLHVNEIINDTAALALSYGKKKDLTEEPKNVVLVDIGSEGTQTVLASFTHSSAKVLASSFNHTGGKVFDMILIEHAVSLIEKKYKTSIGDNVKVRNKLRNALEKLKKQMSANTNMIPVQIDSLVDDLDVQFSMDRAEFEGLIKSHVRDIRETLENLLASTTVKVADIHSVEIVGGSTRIPIIKDTIKEVFGTAPSTSLNADEAVSTGCALHAASLSAKFITKKYDVQSCVHHGVEAMFVHGGQHEKVMICDEGDSMMEEKVVEIAADLPLSIALQYVETAFVENKFIALYKVDGTDTSTGNFVLKFKFDQFGGLDLKEVVLVSEENPKRRKKSGSADAAADTTDDQPAMVPCRTTLDFSRTMPEELEVKQLAVKEAQMVASDQEEIQRQEEKNRLEEKLYKSRHQVTDRSEHVEKEEAYTSLLAYFDEIENWLYEEGEDAPKSSYLEISETLSTKMKVYSVWLEKFMQIKAKEEEREKFIERQKAQESQRQIPVVYEGDDQYVPKQRPSTAFPTRFANRRDPFPRDPFQGFGRAPSSFFDDGWYF